MNIAQLPGGSPRAEIRALAFARGIVHLRRLQPRSGHAMPPILHVLLLAGAVIVVSAAAAAARPAFRKTAVLKYLHDIHNGSAGDYVTWLASGTAAITALLVLLR